MLKRLVILVVTAGVPAAVGVGVVVLVALMRGEEVPFIPIVNDGGEQEDLAVDWARYVSGVESPGELAALIANPNEKWGASSYAYTFVVRGGGNEEHISGTSYILAGEKRLIVEPRRTFSFHVEEVRLEVGGHVWDTLGNVVAPRLTVRNVITEGAGGIQRASAIIRNESLYGLRTIDVAVVLYNEVGEIVGVNTTNIQTVRPQEEREAPVFWPGVIAGATRVEFFVSTNALNSDNLIR